ncbi:hypothetical protein H8711_06400 [Clostridiaceae bacterium NSJ-31]|uniref:Uncharacterized protein n=1 Tax=Ligaoa zhengdingensis TaxID=2763658 RepID=A0A926DZS2_9FIRM|nr:hypothetical protein [Ligaoa zhengdingensis]MBC8546564.1 hypothetical protein [Ligaoa zhengdingensis]
MYDDFSGSCIKGGGHLFTVNGRPTAPLRKPEGFYVFTGLEGSVFAVEVSGGSYCPERVQVDTRALDPRLPVVELRLLRRRGAAFSDCEFVEGIHRPGEMVYALRQGGGVKLLSVSDGEEGTAAAFSGYFIRPPVRTRFFVGTGGRREVFVTGDCGPDGAYLVPAGFVHPHKPGEPVVRAYAARCDGDGRFSIPVEPGQGELITQIEYYNKEGKRWVCSSATGPS